MKNNTYLYLGSISFVLACFLLATKFYQDSQKSSLSFLAKENGEIFVRPYSPRFGNPEAKVFLIEFLDPECESCRSFYPHVKSLLKEFEGKVQLVIRYAPFHGNSKIAVAALEAAKKQGKYWEALEILYEKQPIWGSHHQPQIHLIFDFLATIGIDIDQLKIDMNDPSIEDLLNQEMSDLKQLGVRATPTFFVNGRVPEAFGFGYLKDLIIEQVKKEYD